MTADSDSMVDVFALEAKAVGTTVKKLTFQGAAAAPVLKANTYMEILGISVVNSGATAGELSIQITSDDATYYDIFLTWVGATSSYNNTLIKAGLVIPYGYHPVAVMGAGAADVLINVKVKQGGQ